MVDFSKEYMPESCTEMMEIPMDFVNAVGGDVCACYTLEVEDGDCFDVETELIGGSWYLTAGWREFVEFLSLEKHDRLVFDVRSCSRLCVTMFSSNGCKKEYIRMPDSDDSEWEDLNLVGYRWFSHVIKKTDREGGKMNIPPDFYDMYLKNDINETETRCNLHFNKKVWSVKLVIASDRVKICGGYGKFRDCSGFGIVKAEGGECMSWSKERLVEWSVILDPVEGLKLQDLVAKYDDSRSKTWSPPFLPLHNLTQLQLL